jgi:hypothetical protein
VVNFQEIPDGKPACWRSLLREAGSEKVKLQKFYKINVSRSNKTRCLSVKCDNFIMG